MNDTQADTEALKGREVMVTSDEDEIIEVSDSDDETEQQTKCELCKERKYPTRVFCQTKNCNQSICCKCALKNKMECPWCVQEYKATFPVKAKLEYWVIFAYVDDEDDFYAPELLTSEDHEVTFTLQYPENKLPNLIRGKMKECWGEWLYDSDAMKACQSMKMTTHFTVRGHERSCSTIKWSLRAIEPIDDDMKQWIAASREGSLQEKN